MNDLWQFALLTLWILFVLQGVVLFAIARSLGVLQLQLGPMPGALVTDDGPPLGSNATAIAGSLARGDEAFAWQPMESSALLLFVTPNCGQCRQLLRDATRIALGHDYTERIIAISYGSPEQNRLIAPTTSSLPCVSDPTGELHSAYGIRRTPQAVHVVNGLVVAKGVVNNRDQLERLIEGDAHHGPGALWEKITEAEDLGRATLKA